MAVDLEIPEDFPDDFGAFGVPFRTVPFGAAEWAFVAVGEELRDAFTVVDVRAFCVAEGFLFTQGEEADAAVVVKSIAFSGGSAAHEGP